MSDPAKNDRPESPTTAKALDFDDEPTEAPPTASNSTPASTATPVPGSGEDVAPPKPPRPLAPEQQAENTLKDAFPSIDLSVIKAVLRASGGKMEPAFNALLGMTDPDAAEAPPPPQPPRRPQQSPQRPTTTEEDQVAADERYARQLAEHYSGMGGNPRQGRGPRPQQYGGPPRRATGPTYEEERERSFIDDDLPVIRDNIKKGFLETQSTVNKWVNNLKKRLDGEEEDDFQQSPPASSQGGFAYQQQTGGRRSGEYSRRSTDRDRYDADPQVLGDDFAGLQMQDHEGEPQARPGRPLANPNLFKPTPRPPSSGSGRRVSFQEGPPEEINVHYPKSPSPLAKNSNGKPSKWQPLAAVDPSPVTDNDPFSLGDNSDEDEAKKKDAKPEDTERLKQAAAEAMSEQIGDGSKTENNLEAHERSGNVGQRDKETEDLLNKSQ